MAPALFTIILKCFSSRITPSFDILSISVSLEDTNPTKRKPLKCPRCQAYIGGDKIEAPPKKRKVTAQHRVMKVNEGYM